MRPSLLAGSVCCTVLCTRLAVGAPPDADDLPEEEPANIEPWVPRVGEGRPFSAGVDAYGGFGLLLVSARGDQARAMGGGLFRLSYRYLQAGALVETSNTGEAKALLEPEQEKWFAAGGFVGGIVPFHRWIDVEAVLGLVSRTYSNASRIYGHGAGFEERGPSIIWRLGISARSDERTLGARIGAGFFGAVDTATHEPMWQREYLTADGTIDTKTGTTPVGGVSFGLYMSAGFEISSSWR